MSAISEDKKTSLHLISVTKFPFFHLVFRFMAFIFLFLYFNYFLSQTSKKKNWDLAQCFV
jgi:hypothetical protein